MAYNVSSGMLNPSLLNSFMDCQYGPYGVRVFFFSATQSISTYVNYQAQCLFLFGHVARTDDNIDAKQT